MLSVGGSLSTRALVQITFTAPQPSASPSAVSRSASTSTDWGA
jgi:hypothetical protein